MKKKETIEQGREERLRGLDWGDKKLIGAVRLVSRLLVADRGNPLTDQEAAAMECFLSDTETQLEDRLLKCQEFEFKEAQP